MHFGKLAWLAIKGVHVPVVQVSRCLCLNIFASRCKQLQLMVIILLFFGRRARWQWWVKNCLQSHRSIASLSCECGGETVQSLKPWSCHWPCDDLIR